MNQKTLFMSEIVLFILKRKKEMRTVFYTQSSGSNTKEKQDKLDCRDLFYLIFANTVNSLLLK